MKPIRKAVRTFLIDNKKVVAIKYTTKNNYGYYDIPGGKIEKNETSLDASIREFEEETTMKISNPKYSGNLIIEYPNKIFDLDIYLVTEYSGKPIETKENMAFWIDIEDLLRKDKLFSTIYLLDESHRYYLFNLLNFKWHFISNTSHEKVEEVNDTFQSKSLKLRK